MQITEYLYQPWCKTSGLSLFLCVFFCIGGEIKVISLISNCCFSSIYYNHCILLFCFTFSSKQWKLKVYKPSPLVCISLWHWLICKDFLPLFFFFFSLLLLSLNMYFPWILPYLFFSFFFPLSTESMTSAVGMVQNGIIWILGQTPIEECWTTVGSR